MTTQHSPHDSTASASRPHWRVELTAGAATYLTASYVFLLNPVLLARAGIDVGAAFFATVASAALSTLLMGLWARLPFVVAPAPSITTFFVSYVCLTLGVPWQAAMAAVFLSGILSILLAWLSLREQLIEESPNGLKDAVLCALSGFLVANGLTQAKLIGFSSGWIAGGPAIAASTWLPHILVLATGLGISLVFRIKALRFAGAPVLGILAATMLANMLEVGATTTTVLGPTMFSSFMQLDFGMLLDTRVGVAILGVLVIDFFGGIGKYIGLFRVLERQSGFDLSTQTNRAKTRRALYVDGWGNIFGAVFGASSIAVFVSSAVGVISGGRTGLTAVFAACFMLASLVFIPLVGAIPIEATSGVLIYVGLLLWPITKRDSSGSRVEQLGQLVALVAAGVSFVTYSVDRALLVGFAFYSIVAIQRGVRRGDTLLLVVTLLLAGAVFAQTLR